MRNILTIFIASPSDLAPEREAAFRITDELNGTLKSINWSIDLLGWEDTLPGFGRPQSLINKDVARCDLFVGLLWRKWGTPPSIGSSYTSGFEEEFAIATTRRQSGDAPEIWMFFKTVDGAQADDAGPELSKVLAFKDQLVASKLALFKEFDALTTWEEQLRTYLLRHVLTLAGEKQRASEPTQAPAIPAGTNPSMVTAQPATSDAVAQLQRVWQWVVSTAENVDLDALTDSDDDSAAFVAARVSLTAATLSAAVGIEELGLRTHELNALYKERQRLAVTDAELTLILRTMISDRASVNPGWFWFANWDDAASVRAIFWLALWDQSEQVRVRSLDLLRKTRTSPPDSVREKFLSTVLAATQPEIREAMWAYLVEVATDTEISALSADPSSWLAPRIDWLRRWSADRNVEKLIQAGIPSELVPGNLRSTIAQLVGSFSEETLRRVEQWMDFEASSAAVIELERRGLQPSADRLQKKHRSFAGLLNPFREAPSKDEQERNERRAALKTASDADVVTALDWYSVDAPFAYRVLAERGALDPATVRTDIKDNFERIRTVGVKRLETTYGTDSVPTFEEYEPFIRQQFVRAAWEILATDPAKEDLAIARQSLAEEATRESAVRIIAAVGDGEDVPSLLDIAKTSIGAMRTSALQGLERIAVGDLEIADDLLQGDTDELRRAGVRILRAHLSAETTAALARLLRHPDDAARLSALRGLWERLDRQGCEALLREYLEESAYFYNVVTWLDRLLYAPPNLCHFYTEDLHSRT